MEVRWQIDRHAWLQSDYGVFFAGEFSKTGFARSEHQLHGVLGGVQILMRALSDNAIRFARVLIAIVLVLNAIGVIDQTLPAKEMMEHGAPAAIVPSFMLAGRTVELLAGFALVFGIFPRAALALLGFPIPVTPVSHSFWLSAGTPVFMGQLINFSKNVAICGGLLFIGASLDQPVWGGSGKNERLVCRIPGDPLGHDCGNGSRRRC